MISVARRVQLAVVVLVGCGASSFTQVGRPGNNACPAGLQPAITDTTDDGTPIWTCRPSCEPGSEYVSNINSHDRGVFPNCVPKCKSGWERNQYFLQASDTSGCEKRSGQCEPVSEEAMSEYEQTHAHCVAERAKNDAAWSRRVETKSCRDGCRSTTFACVSRCDSTFGPSSMSAQSAQCAGKCNDDFVQCARACK